MTITEVIDLLRAGAVADLVVVTLDFSRQTGGRRITLKQASLTGSNHSTREHGTITVREHHRFNQAVTVHTALIEKCNGMPVL